MKLSYTLTEYTTLLPPAGSITTLAVPEDLTGFSFHLDGRLDDSLETGMPEISFITIEGSVQKLQFKLWPHVKELGHYEGTNPVRYQEHHPICT